MLNVFKCFYSNRVDSNYVFCYFISLLPFSTQPLFHSLLYLAWSSSLVQLPSSTVLVFPDPIQIFFHPSHSTTTGAKERERGGRGGGERQRERENADTQELFSVCENVHEYLKAIICLTANALTMHFIYLFKIKARQKFFYFGYFIQCSLAFHSVRYVYMGSRRCKCMPSKCGRTRVIIQLIPCCCMWLFALILYFASVNYSEWSKIGVILSGSVSLLLLVSRQICHMRLRILRIFYIFLHYMEAVRVGHMK